MDGRQERGRRGDTVKRGAWTAVVVAVSLLAIELTPIHEAHGDHWWHHLPGFDLLYGLAGCVAIVLVSKALGSAWLERDARYYEDRS